MDICVVSFPRVLNITREMFEKRQAHGVKFVELPCAWVPLAGDVLSLEYDDKAIREMFVNQLCSSLPYDVAYALYSGGFAVSAATVQAKGRISCKVAEMLRRMRREEGRGLATRVNAMDVTDARNFEGLPVVSELVLIDRFVDMVTPMCTQLTYEGLLDEVFGMRYGQIKQGPLKMSGLTDDDPVFRETRNKMFPGARAWVNAALREIQQFRDQQMAGADVSALRGFVNSLKDNFSRISQHALLMEKLGSKMSAPAFAARQRVEAAMLEDAGTSLAPMASIASMAFAASSQVSQPLHDIIYKGDELTSVLRLMCLLCAVGGGIPKREFDVLRKEVLNTYGFEHIETFERLQETGVLYEEADRSRRSAFMESKAKLKLLVDDGSKIDAENPDDMHFAYAGYAPWSCRLVEEALCGDGWQTRLDSSVPTIHVRQGVAEDGSAKDTVVKSGWEGTRKKDGESTLKGENGSKTVLVMFIGGVTHAEISVLRWLATKTDRRILVGCTGVINGDRLVTAFT